MHTLPDNYKKNIDILKINLRRGLKVDQANQAIAKMQAQFEKAGLYGQLEQEYINRLYATVIEYTTKIKVRV